MNDVISFIKSLNIGDEKIVLACSYGPDSMFLLNVLYKLDLDIVVAYVNHKMRIESDDEEKLLCEYSKKLGIGFESYSIMSYPKGNKEAYARSERYKFFDKVVKKYSASFLFTAHHGDDLVETVLMRISRGASIRGYAGFRKLSDNNSYKIIRPLVYMTKDEIVKYNDEHNIPYAIDSTNNSDDYTRNRYRHHVLPELKKINKNVHRKFLKYSDTLNEYFLYVDDEVDKHLSEVYKDNRIDLNLFRELPLLIRKNILNKILLNLYDNDINKISDEHIYLLLNLIDGDKASGYVCLPNNLKVIKFYNILEFDYNIGKESFDFVLNNDIKKDDWVIKIVDKTDIVKSNYLIRISSKDVSLPLHVRSRRIGDKISLKNSGTKKIGDVFTDSKVSIFDRDNYPIMTDNDDNVLWIPGIKKSIFDRQIDEEYDIIVKYIKKGGKDEEK